ncbi:hypothetical protein [Gracilimonas mengyeensis]|uniref:Uncharacterized protein n=1 Tax=Gracilimonas mengyeensis TaxID=1302730 RepID=A0A521EJS0_9BACT|nr:hypothetical protein [Gracilimonas mengyeensis]SMO84167.1 hypothetical protein SAMN06265219_11287 [Gracilimonas mengyeensis]
MKINNRLAKLEAEAPSDYFFNCLTNKELERLVYLISKENSKEEFKDLIELDNKAKRDARVEFLKQYDIAEPLNVRSVFNAFKEYQHKKGRVDQLGHSITGSFPAFNKFLINKGYHINESE